MPYNWNGDYILSKTDKSTDIWGQLISPLSDIKTIYLPMTGRNTALFQYASRDMSQPFPPMIPCPARDSLLACVILPDRWTIGITKSHMTN